MEVREDIVWLLDRIQYCVNETIRRKDMKFSGWESTKKYIFMGSYDVWHGKDDQKKFNDIMDYRLNELRDLGLTETESGECEWGWRDNWKLTELGKDYLARSRGENAKT